MTPFNFDALHEAMETEHPDLIEIINGERYAKYVVEHNNGENVVVTVLPVEEAAHVDADHLAGDMLSLDEQPLAAVKTLDVGVLMQQYAARGDTKQ
jgi:hypothetical protein